jgi:hypothetical protein
VADLKPANRRYLFLDLLYNKSFVFIKYSDICRAELRDTFTEYKVVLITITASIPVAFYAEDKQDAEKIIEKVNNRATGMDLM